METKVLKLNSVPKTGCIRFSVAKVKKMRRKELRGDCDLYLGALKEYLLGREWKETISIFIDANCEQFRNAKEFSHSHHETWKNFQEIADNILSVAIENIGGNLQSLEYAIEEIVLQPPTGPRDEACKEILKQLLSFHDFEEFCKVMESAAKEKVQTIPADNYRRAAPSPMRFKENLLQFGFEEDLIELVLSNCEDNVSLEELVMKLSEMQHQEAPANKRQPPRRQTNSTSSAYSPASSHTHGRRPNYADKYDDKSSDRSSSRTHREERKNENNATNSHSNPSFDALGMFLVQCGIQEEVNEFHAKFVMAKSVIDVMAEDYERNPTSSESQMELLQWSADMIEFYEDIVLPYQKVIEALRPSEYQSFLQCRGMGAIDYSSLPNRYGQPLLHCYTALEKRRADIEAVGLDNGLLSDAELKRMAELDQIVQQGSESEQHLHSLLTRFLKLKEEIDALHKKISLRVAADRHVPREKLEELYLYLKEQVNSGMPIEQLADDMMVRIQQILPNGGDMIIECLLDMHVKEDEQMLLRREIDAFDSADGKGGSSLGPSEPMFASYDGNSNEYENGSQEYIGEYASEGNGYGNGYDNDYKGTEDNTQYEYKDSGDANYGYDSNQYGSGYEATETSDYYNNGDSNNTGNYTPNDVDTGSNEISEKRGRNMQSTADVDNSDYLESMKNNHKNALQALKSRLDAEKARRVKSLEAKLMQRRLQSLSSSQDTSVREVELELSNVKQNFDEVQIAVINGFKKRCVQEMKATKAKGAKLTGDELEECHKDAARAIKEKYEKDHKNLVLALENERMRQKSKILKTLASKRNSMLSKNGNDTNSLALDPEWIAASEETKSVLNRLYQNFDSQETSATSKPQNELMLSLASVYLDDNLIDSLVSKKSSKDNDLYDDDEGYLDEDSGENGEEKLKSQLTEDWLKNVENLGSMYLAAGQQLQEKSRQLTRSAMFMDGMENKNDAGLDEIDSLVRIVESGGFEDLDAFSNEVADESSAEVADINIHMMNVIQDAYTRQIKDVNLQNLSDQNSDEHSRKSRLAVDASADRVKAEILEEFEKSKVGFEKVLERSRLSSQERLAKRLYLQAQAKETRESKDLGPYVPAMIGEQKEVIHVTKTQAAMEAMVDSFLQDPIEIVKSAPKATLGKALPNIYGGTPNSNIKSNKKNGRVMLAPLGHSPKALFDSDAKETGSRFARELESTEKETLARAERDVIKSKHAEKEKDLVDGLYSQMVLKKHMLEERLRKKREERERLKSAAGNETVDIVDSMNDDKNEESEEIAQLEKAFDNVVKIVKTADDNRLEMLNIEDVVRAMDKASQGESITFADIVQESNTSHAQRIQEHRSVMKEEAKRIASAYNEEKEKYDLIMKMQRARQRQNLQRKLLERKQNNSNAISADTTSASLTNNAAIVKQLSTRGLSLDPMLRK